MIGSRGVVEIDPREIMSRDASILGMRLFNIASGDFASAHAAIGAGLRQGTLCPIVGTEFALPQSAKAHHAVMENSALGKVVLIPG